MNKRIWKIMFLWFFLSGSCVWLQNCATTDSLGITRTVYVADTDGDGEGDTKLTESQVEEAKARGLDPQIVESYRELGGAATGILDVATSWLGPVKPIGDAILLALPLVLGAVSRRKDKAIKEVVAAIGTGKRENRKVKETIATKGLSVVEKHVHRLKKGEIKKQNWLTVLLQIVRDIF